MVQGLLCSLFVIRLLATLTILVWLIGLAVGLVAATSPASRRPAAQWPAQTRLAAETGNRLILFAHTTCPCTRASFSDLTALMVRVHGSLHATIVFMGPDGLETSESWAAARAIPFADVIRDNGDEAARFGVTTSGTALLYDGAGALRFDGPVDAQGRTAIELLLTRGAITTTSIPVNGQDLRAAP